MPVLKPGGGAPVVAINPNSRATRLTPAGVADLLVIKQHIKRYEPGEVSHIENVLKGESKKRVTRSARTTDQTFTTQQETTSTEQRDLQTTERFELKQEVSSTVKDDFSLKTGVAMSISYGGMLDIKTNLDFALDHSQEETTKNASTYAKDVTNRAASTVTQRTMQSQVSRLIETFEDNNEHGIDNTQGAEPVIGVYQWVDKIYEMQLFQLNGKRLMFDFMVPEPAAFLLRAFGQPDPALGAKPELLSIPPANQPDQTPHLLQPWDITEDNYGDYASQYEVAIPPPPRPNVTVSTVLEDKQDLGKSVTATKSATIQIPDGYRADKGICRFTALGDPGFDYENQHIRHAPRIVVNVGSQLSRSSDWDPNDFNVQFGAKDDRLLDFSNDPEVDKLSIAVQAAFFVAYTVSIEVSCVPTDRAGKEWRLNAYSTVVQAYLKRLSDYEDRLAAKGIQSTGQPGGSNPAANRTLERTELKKGCISLLTKQLENLDAIALPSADDPNPIPQIDFTLPDANSVLAQGAYIRFFEQAFEWEQMMYFFYPYFWGREENWFNRAILTGDDALFAEFLKAGEARVAVPVRPGFEAAVLHFLDTGEIWNGGDVPKIGSPLYVSIIQEIEDSQRDPEMTLLDHWEVAVPTSLVKLRPDGSLPSWTYQNGSWVPA